jgi:hypothetical protein
MVCPDKSPYESPMHDISVRMVILGQATEAALHMEAATTLVKLRHLCATNITGFEILDTICTRKYFYKFANNRSLLTRLLSMVVMVIGYLDIEDASNFQFNEEIMKDGFINHLEQWHQRVSKRSIINHIESYLVDKKNILSNVSFIDASRDAQRYIIDIRNFVIKDMRDFTLNGILETKFQTEMMLIMRCSFYQTKSSTPEFGLFFQLISNLVITRFTALFIYHK